MKNTKKLLYHKMELGENLEWCRPVEFRNFACTKYAVLIIQHGCKVANAYFWTLGGKHSRRVYPAIFYKNYNFEAEDKSCLVDNPNFHGDFENALLEWFGPGDAGRCYDHDLGCCDCPARTTCDAMHAEF